MSDSEIQKIVDAIMKMRRPVLLYGSKVDPKTIGVITAKFASVMKSVPGYTCPWIGEQEIYAIESDSVSMKSLAVGSFV